MGERPVWTRKSAFWAAGAAATGVLLFIFSPSGTQARERLPEEPLPVLSGNARVSLAHCPTEKCLTVYVAPWCGYCRASTAMIVELRDHLGRQNVASRIVVGMDSAEPLREYARSFGPDTLIDAEGAVGVKGGVPHFYVSDRSGRVLREVAGVPQQGIQDVGQFAAYFGLP